MRYLAFTLSCLLFVLTMGCDLVGESEPKFDAPQPTPVDGVEVKPGLAGRLVAPDTVTVHQPFDVRVEVTNLSGSDLMLTTPTSCLVDLSVRTGEDERAHFQGTNVGCLQVITTREIAPTDTVGQHFDVRAELAESSEPVPPGTYILRGLITRVGEETAETDTLESELVVRR